MLLFFSTRPFSLILSSPSIQKAGCMHGSDRHDTAAPAARPRLVQNLPIHVLYAWVCEALSVRTCPRFASSPCCGRAFPLGLSTSLVHAQPQSASHHAHAVSNGVVQLVRPRCGDCLHMALLRQLAHSDVPSPHDDNKIDDQRRVSWAQSLRQWRVVVALCLPLPHVSSASLDKTVASLAGLTDTWSVAVPQRLVHENADGQGRRLLIFAVLLGLLLDPEPHGPMPRIGSLNAESVMTRTVASLFLTGSAGDRVHYPIFSSDAAGRASASSLLNLPAVHRERVRVRQLLKRLLHPRAVQVRSRPRLPDDSAGEWHHWYDWAETRAVDALARQNDVHAPVTECGENVVSDPWLRGTVHHLVCTTLEGEAAETITRLLVDYLSYPVIAMASVAHRLETLAHHPEAALVLSQTSPTLLRLSAAAPSAAIAHNADFGSPSTTCFLGPLSCSHVVATAVLHVLPCVLSSERTEAGAQTPALYWSAPALLSGVTGSPAPHGTIGSRHVLLLRVDPEGDWLPPGETTRNTQTFFTYYANDNAENGEDQEEGGDRFAVLEARQAGRRVVPDPLRAPRVPQPAEVCTRPSPLLAQTETLVTHAASLLRQEAAATTTAPSPSASPPHLVEATLRLYLYALLLSATASPCGGGEDREEDGLFVILTPERAPLFMKQFGLRHGAWLRRLVHQHLVRTQETPPRPTRALVNEDAIHLVDDVQLAYFEHLQTRVTRHHGASGAESGTAVTTAAATTTAATGFVSSSAAVLCRDHIRQPLDPHDALLRAVHVSVTTSAQLFPKARARGSQRGLTPPQKALPLTAYVTSPAAFFTTTTGAHPSTDAVPSRFHVALRTQQFCVIQLDVRQFSDGYSARKEDEETSAGARLVLVAPTPHLARLYESTARHAAATLLSVYTHPDPQRRVLVRGGGAYLIAVAAQLHHLSEALASGGADAFGKIEVRDRDGCGGAAEDDGVLSAGADYSPNRRCLAWLLRRLSVAVLAVPLHLWELKRREVSTGWSVTVPSCSADDDDDEASSGRRHTTPPQQRAMWALAVQRAMQCTLTSRLTDPSQTIASVTVELVSHATHIARMLNALRENVCPGDEAVLYPLVEPIEPNRAAVRGSLELLLHALTVSAV